MDIDSKLKWFTIVSDGIIKDLGMAGKLVFIVMAVKNERFPFRVSVDYNKQKFGMAVEGKITLKEYERKFEDFLKNDVKANSTGPKSIFSI